MSRHQEATQTWLAYDRVTNHSSASAPSLPAIDVTEDTKSLISESTLDKHQDPSLNGSKPTSPTGSQPGDKARIKEPGDKVPESPLWNSFLWLFSLLTLGLILAVGHHVVFEHLDGKPVSSFSQIWINRVSNGVALVVKMCWTLAVGLAFPHTLWYSFRRNYIKIRSVDKLFDLRSDILGFLSLDCFRGAPVAMGLATITWLLPALPVIVPGTLSVQINLNGFKQSFPCTVPAFGQGGQDDTDFSIRNSTSNEIITDDVGDPTPQIEKVVADVLLGNGVALFPSPCGPNCTYELVFYGPGLDCEPHPNYMVSAKSAVLTDTISTETRLNSSARLEESPHNWTSPSSPDFLDHSPFPVYAATEPDLFSSKFSTIWIQFFNNDSVSPIKKPSVLGFEPAQVDQSWGTLACTLQNTTYSPNVGFEDGFSAINTTKVSSTPLDITSSFGGKAQPHDAQYLGPASALFTSLAGSIFAVNLEGKAMLGPYVNDTQISPSNLVNITMLYEDPAKIRRRQSPQSEGVPVFLDAFLWSVTSNFTTGIPDLLTNITLNMLAANAPTYNTTCQSTRTEIVYQYNQDSSCSPMALDCQQRSAVSLPACMLFNTTESQWTAPSAK